MTYAWLTIFLWSLELVYARFAVTRLNIDSTFYACASLALAALTLLLIGGRGQRCWRAMKSPYTWAYGVCQILLNISFIYTLTLITTTELSFLMRGAILAQFLAAYLLHKRGLSKQDFPGILLIAASVIIVALDIPAESRQAAWLGATLSILFACLRMSIAETHPLYYPNDGIRQRCRITGAVLLTTSLIFLAGLFTAEHLRISADFPNLVLPDFRQLAEPHVLLICFIGGSLLLAPAFYCFFYACQHIQAENFALLTAFLPLLTFTVEFLSSHFAALSFIGVSTGDIAAGIIGTLGAIGIIINRRRRQRSAAIGKINPS